MKLHYDNPEHDVRIELIPLIDVIFCILTFFILAAVTLTRQTAINVDLPRASTGSAQMRELLIVSVDPVGQTYIEKQPVSQEQLYEAMLSFRQSSPNGLIVLYASRLASYNDVVEVLDLLRSVGGSRVALATLPNTSNSSGQFQPPSSDTINPNDPLQLPGLTDPSSDSSLELPGLPGSFSNPSSPSGLSPVPGSSPGLGGTPNLGGFGSGDSGRSGRSSGNGSSN